MEQFNPDYIKGLLAQQAMLHHFNQLNQGNMNKMSGISPEGYVPSSNQYDHENIDHNLDNYLTLYGA